jgi:UDP-glucose 4-epimerase
MRVLVTGGAGYIGSQVVRQLLGRSHEVVVLDNLQEGNKASIAEGATLVVGDVRDEGLVDRVFANRRFDAVMHFAGVISMGESMEDPHKYFAINTFGALALFERMVTNHVLKAIFSSTAGVYGNPERVPIREEDRKEPTNPYGQSKLMVEQMLRWFDRSHGLRSISLRYFNAAGATLDGTCGEAHRAETHIIPLAMRAAASNQEFTLFGEDYRTKDGTCVRDYVHVEDLGIAHILALEALMAGHETDAFNVGPGGGYSNREVIEMVKKVTGIDLQVRIGQRRPGDADELVADAGRIKERLGWKPGHSDLRTIVESAWLWHSTHPAGYG